MFLVLACSCLCTIYWNQVLSGEWRCSWSSADRRCSNYIWVINNFIAYYIVHLILETWRYVVSFVSILKKKKKWLNRFDCNLSETQGLHSVSAKTSYHQISWSLEMGCYSVVYHWNLTGPSASPLLRWQSNFGVIGKLQAHISWLWDLVRAEGAFQKCLWALKSS